MATYKLGATSICGVPPNFVSRRPLICEQCAQALGNVDSLPAYKGMSAVLVGAMWPEIRGAAERHDALCALVFS